MSRIYDLTKITQVVESQHPARILIIDTNVVMNNPIFTDWSVTTPGSNLFVLSDTIIHELEHISQRTPHKDKAESSKKAELSIKSIAGLFNKGNITKGIPIQTGWIIGVPSPKKDELNPELEQLEDFVSAFKRSDTKLLLLTRECHQLFKTTPVTLITGEWNLFNAVQMQGVPCHLCTNFPIEYLNETTAVTKPINWEQVLDEIQSDTKQKAIVFEATLTSQKLASSWLSLVTSSRKFMIAEGQGSLRYGGINLPFLWTIAFYPFTMYPISSDDNETQFDLPSVHLDFLGGNNLEQDIFDAIADKLIGCASVSFEEGTPTLQNPESIMGMLLWVEYLMTYAGGQKSTEDLIQEIEESEGLVSYWTDWILDKEDEDERYACLYGFIEAINECWKIGQTYTFSIIKGQEK